METKKRLSLVAALFVGLLTLAQSNQTLTNFYTVPQSTLINPALRLEGDLHIGLPGLSSVGAYFNQTLFSLSLFSPDTDFQQELESQVGDLTVDDYFQTSVDYDLFFVGFRLGEKGYLSLGASYRMAQTAKLAPDMMKFLVNGNAPYIDEQLDWSPTSTTGHHYAFYHVGYSHSLLEDKLRIGARVKLVSGLGAIQTNIDEWSVTTQATTPNPYTVQLTAGGAINAAGIPDDDLSAGDLVRFGYDFSNFGLGLDFGAQYRINDEWSVTASVQDLGNVTWATEAENWVIANQTIEITGITDDLFNDEDTTSFGDKLSSYFDSIGELLNPDTTFSEFTTSLNRKINLGVQWRFHPKHEVGLQYYNEDAFGIGIQAFGLSYYGDLTNWFQVKVQYTAYNQGFDNFGAGFALGRTFQWHFMADYLQGATNIENLNEFNFRTGFALNFGTKDKSVDVPTESPVEAPIENAPEPAPEEGGGGGGGGLVYYYD